jgi:hypothetical protein
MKIKLEKVWDSQVALQTVQDLRLPIKMSYWLGRNIQRLSSEIKDIDKKRVELVKKYGVENEQHQFNVTPENKDKFVKEFEELLSEEVEIDIKQYTIEEFGNAQLSPEVCIAIEFMIKEA